MSAAPAISIHSYGCQAVQENMHDGERACMCGSLFVVGGEHRRDPPDSDCTFGECTICQPAMANISRGWSCPTPGVAHNPCKILPYVLALAQLRILHKPDGTRRPASIPRQPRTTEHSHLGDIFRDWPWVIAISPVCSSRISRRAMSGNPEASWLSPMLLLLQ